MRSTACLFLPCTLWLCVPSASADVEVQTPVMVKGLSTDQKQLDVPFAVSVVDAQALRQSGPMWNLAEAMARVPGLLVADRGNYAQDQQISSRGFGARSSFGVRGLRLYTDGIPATMPDGQGQVAHFDLAGTARLEVVRGPHAVLYGASSGGVIALTSQAIRDRRLELNVDGNSEGAHQARVALASPLPSPAGALTLQASASRLHVAGFRPQSAATRQLAHLRLGWQGEQDRLNVALSQHEQDAQDPLGLPFPPAGIDPHATTPEALQFDTRKSVHQRQLGMSWVHDFHDSGPLRQSSLAAYAGSRGILQFLAIPAATQANPRHGGGVVQVDRHFEGLEAKASFGAGAAELVVGTALERQDDARKGYENFTRVDRALVLGTMGALRRDERNQAATADLFFEARYDWSPAWSATLGARTGHLDVEVRDAYVVPPGNIDDSGRRRFRYTNPTAALGYALRPDWKLYASLARGYETPTLAELAYGPGDGGFNRTLQGQRSTQGELGSKYRTAALEWDAVLFHTRTTDEIGVLSNAAGRATYQNIGRTLRYGAEFSGQWQLHPGWRLSWAWTALSASNRDGFETCTGAPCPSASLPKVQVASGQRLVGTQARTAWVGVAWQPRWMPGELGMEWRGQSRTPVSDARPVSAAGFGITHLRWSRTLAMDDGSEWQAQVRVDNVLNRAYAGTVIVNDGNGRFLEPGAPRTLSLSVRWTRRL